jgi:hypothetical protein
VATVAIALMGSLVAGCTGSPGPPIRAEVTPPAGYRIIALAGAPDGGVWLLLATLGSLDDTRPAAAVMHVDAHGRGVHTIAMPRYLMTPAGGIAVDGQGVVWFGLTVGTATRPTTDTGLQLADPQAEIGRLDGDRVVEYAVPGQRAAVRTLTGAAAGVWFTAYTDGGDEYGRVTADGRVAAYPGPDRVADLESVLPGPRESVWVEDYHSCTLALVGPGAAWPQPPTASLCGGLLPGSGGGLHVLASNEVTSLSAAGTVTGQAVLPVQIGDSGRIVAAVVTAGGVWMLTAHQVTPGVDYTVPVLWQVGSDGSHRRLQPVPADPITIPSAYGTPAATLTHRIQEATARLMVAGSSGRLWLASDGLLMLVDTGGPS